MQQSNSIRWAALCFYGLIILILTAGCGHHISSTVSTPVPVMTAASAAAPAAFQPYTLLPAPPPVPPVTVPRHLVLHVTRVHNRVYLVDSDRHLYEAGRDPQGHIYPVYHDPATHMTYPLYYDPSRDNLYRLARQEHGHFYRNYVGQSANQFYDTDRDYERTTPNDYDRPIVTDSYNTYNYNTYNDDPNVGHRYSNGLSHHPYYPYYAGYHPPPAHQASHFHDNWLWAIPVIVGVYLLLQPHHHAPPRPIYNRPRQAVVNQITQAAPVGYQPFASHRHVPVVAATAAGAAIRAATLARPNVRPALPAPNARPSSFTPRLAALAAPARPVSPLHPMLRPHVQHIRLAVPVSSPPQRVPVIIHRPPTARTVSRSVVHPFVPARPHVVAIPRQSRKLARPRTQRPRVIVSLPPHLTSSPRPAARPASIAPPRRATAFIARPRPAAVPRREETHPALHIAHPALHIAHPALHIAHPALHIAHPALHIAHPALHIALRVEHAVLHAAPHAARPAAMPRRLSLPPAHITVRPRPMVRPRVVRPAKPQLAGKKRAAPKKDEKPDDAAKPDHGK